EHDGDTGNEQAFKFHDPNPVDIFGMAQRAEEFMQKSMKAGKPFYIQLSWNALHASENANKATLAKYQSKLSGENEKRITTAAITEDLDTGVGKVIDSIDRLGLAK
ncbi:MAG: sulfatase, partial [Pirellula sp.]